MKYKANKVLCKVADREYLFKSHLEAKVAGIIQLWKDVGIIKDWDYERTAFVFPDDKWKVDFDILNPDGTFYYIEAKGYIDNRTKRYLKLLNKYRPEITVDFFLAHKNDLQKLRRCRKYIRNVYVITKTGYSTI